MEVFLVFEDGLSKPAMATRAEGSISTSDLPSCFSFGKESISDDDDIQNYDDVGELSIETECHCGSICYRYLELEKEQHNVLTM